MGDFFKHVKDGEKDLVLYDIRTNRVDINQQDKAGDTALMHAARSNHKDIVEILLYNNANIYMKNKDGATALMIASATSGVEIIDLLTNSPLALLIQDIPVGPFDNVNEMEYNVTRAVLLREDLRE